VDQTTLLWMPLRQLPGTPIHKSGSVRTAFKCMLSGNILPLSLAVSRGLWLCSGERIRFTCFESFYVLLQTVFVVVVVVVVDRCGFCVQYWFGRLSRRAPPPRWRQHSVQLTWTWAWHCSRFELLLFALVFSVVFIGALCAVVSRQFTLIRLVLLPSRMQSSLAQLLQNPACFLVYLRSRAKKREKKKFRIT